MSCSGVLRQASVVVAVVVLVVMAGPSEAFMEWLFNTPKDLCQDLCDCPKDVILASQEGINCVGRNMTYIPEKLDIPEVYPSITFARNYIQAVARNSFAPSTTLTSLDISDNLLQGLSAGVFEPLQALSLLRLSNNNITTIDPKALAGLSKLTQLDLSYNNIERLPKEVFEDLESLEDLNLGFNPVSSLNESIFKHTPNLKTLDLSKLGLESIPPNLFLGNLTKLEKVLLAYNHLSVVPSRALNTLHSSLLHLDLSGNPISSLGAFSFYGLTELRVLILEQMLRLKTIEAYAFGDLTQLDSIVLRYLSWIETIDPKAFYTKLDDDQDSPLTVPDFTLSFSSLHTLPEHLLPWNQLRYISLEYNHWLCDCNMRWVKNTTKIVQMTGTRMICVEPQRLEGRRLIYVKDENLTCGVRDNPTRGAVGFLAVVMIAGLSASLATVSLLVYWQRGWVCRRPPQGGYRTIQRNGSTITITDDVTSTSEA